MGTKTTQRFCVNDDRYVLAQRNTPSNVLHLLLTLVTCGFWIPIWILVAIFSDGTYRCTQCGSATRARAPWGWRPRA